MNESTTEELKFKGIMNGKKAFIGPEHVVIDPTNRCNLDCIGCWTFSPLLEEKAPDAEWRKRQLSRTSLMNLVSDLAEIGTERIRFTGGGEPFLHPDILDAIKKVKEMGMVCAVTTNGTLFNEKMIHKLAELEVDELAVSVWAATPETYLKTHPGSTKGTFYNMEEMLKLLSSIKKDNMVVTLCNVISNLNYHEFEQMLNFGKDVGADALYFTVTDIIDGKTNSLILSAEQNKQILSFVDSVREKAKEYGITLDNFNGFVERLMGGEKGSYDSVSVDEIPCYVGWYFTRILANGDVSPCCRGVDRIMGNINTNSFKDIWYGKKMDEFRYNAKHLKKDDPYFAEIGCYKCCDNLMHNRQVHEMIHF